VLLHYEGDLLAARGDLAGAAARLEASVAMRRRLAGRDDLQVARALHALGAVRARAGDRAAADTLFGRALALRRAGLAAGAPYVRESERALAALRAGRPAPAPVGGLR
jgi:hypothetical protein